jgi:hypothetical protein
MQPTGGKATADDEDEDEDEQRATLSYARLRRPDQNRLFADHVTAEYRVRTEGRGRTVDEWKLPANRPDNHWFDWVVGCAAAASMQGIERVGARVGQAPSRARLRLSELQRVRK